MGDVALVNDLNQDWGNAANFLPAAIPVDGDRIFFYDVGKKLTITVGVDVSGVLDNVTLHFDGFKGQIGTAADPLKIGNTGGNSDVIFDAPGCDQVNLDLTTDTVYVTGTPDLAKALNLVGGTHGEIRVLRGLGVNLGASATATFVVVDGNGAKFSAEDGNTIPTVEVIAGQADLSTLVSDLDIADGLVRLLGPAKTYPAIDVWGANGELKLDCDGAIITKINAKRGRVWSGSARIITVTNMDIGRMASIRTGGNVLYSNNPINFGSGDVHILGDFTNKFPQGGTPVGF